MATGSGPTFEQKMDRLLAAAHDCGAWLRFRTVRPETTPSSASGDVAHEELIPPLPEAPPPVVLAVKSSSPFRMAAGSGSPWGSVALTGSLAQVSCGIVRQCSFEYCRGPLRPAGGGFSVRRILASVLVRSR